MHENVVEFASGIMWEPSAPSTVLISTGTRSALALDAHFTDLDERCVVFVFEGVRFAQLGPPNDESRAGHRLYRQGLSDIIWAASVLNSSLIASLEIQNRVHPQHDARLFDGLMHYLIPLKEETVEIVGRACRTVRLSGTTRAAALSALDV